MGGKGTHLGEILCDVAALVRVSVGRDLRIDGDHVGLYAGDRNAAVLDGGGMGVGGNGDIEFQWRGHLGFL